MFIKLLKHDMLDLGKSVGFLLLMMLGYGLLMSRSIFPLFLASSQDTHPVFLVIVYLLSLVVFAVIIVRRLFKDMARTFFGPSAYLLFSLPVSTHAIILHKVLTTSFWLMPIFASLYLAVWFVDVDILEPFFSVDLLASLQATDWTVPWQTFATLALLFLVIIMFAMLVQTLTYTLYQGRRKRLVGLLIMGLCFILMFSMIEGLFEPLNLPMPIQVVMIVIGLYAIIYYLFHKRLELSS
ncbi:MAG: hypothetical protein EA374_02425 [Acholeplasmatales bacterium]|nr:MAG: hypothetical protein EA374_02425 [Acholeplasmatales bacterium]